MPEHRLVLRELFHTHDQGLDAYVMKSVDTEVWRGPVPPNEDDIRLAAVSAQEIPAIPNWVGPAGVFETQDASALVEQSRREFKLGRWTLAIGWKDTGDLAQPLGLQTGEAPATTD